jgi:electron transport complex protein RnfD
MTDTIIKRKKRKLIPPVMLDVIIVLMPLVLIACWAFGWHAMSVIGGSLLGAFVSEIIFSYIFLNKKDSFRDGSALITGLLLAFTLSPLTPWYIAAFGGATAVLFGKILWGGMGRNLFNPALVGREFMTVFFVSVMNGADIWKTKTLVEHSPFQLFDGVFLPSLSGYFDKLIYNPAGAIGEYSALFLILGGLYLIVRKRISWHIPFGILVTIVVLIWLLPNGENIKYSLSGVLLGAIFMATDLPTSPSNNNGKLFYGIVMGLVVVILILGGVSFEYMSYSILILNGFSKKITNNFHAKNTLHWIKRTENTVLLLLQILTVTLAVLTLHYYGFVQYILWFFIAYIIFKFVTKERTPGLSSVH